MVWTEGMGCRLMQAVCRHTQQVSALWRWAPALLLPADLLRVLQLPCIAGFYETWTGCVRTPSLPSGTSTLPGTTSLSAEHPGILDLSSPCPLLPPRPMPAAASVAPPPPPPVNPGSFTPAAIFTSIALFGLMRFPLIFLPFALIQLSNALVSMRRLSAYFMLEERTDEVQELDHPGGLVLLHDLLLSPTCVAAHGGGQGRHRAA